MRRSQAPTGTMTTAHDLACRTGIGHLASQLMLGVCDDQAEREDREGDGRRQCDLVRGSQ